MALSDLDFLEHRNRRFVIEPFKDSALTPTGYDLRFGFGIKLPQERTDDPEISSKMASQPTKLTIPKHHGALFVTLERIRLSGRVIGTIHGKSRFSAKGLITQSVTVDPNFGVGKQSGRLFLYFYNTSPFSITISSKDPIATLVLSSLESETPTPPATRTYEDILGHYDTAYATFMDKKSKVCDPVREYLNSYKDSEGEREFEKAIQAMEALRESRFLPQQS